MLAGIAGIGRGLFASGYVVFMSFVPPLLIMGGLSISEASLLTSLAAIVSLFAVPLGGYLSDRTGRTDQFIVLGAIGTAATCLLLPHAAPAFLWILLFGLLRGGCTGGIMAMPARALRPASRRAGFAISSIAYFVLMAGVPALAGVVLDLTGDLRAPLWFAAAVWLLIVLQLAVFRLLVNRWIA